MALNEFRTEVRAWLEEYCPASMRGAVTVDTDLYWGGRDAAFSSEEQRLWLESMVARGWTAPTWPREYGGGGLDAAEAKVLREEMQRIDARSPLASFGISMLGPALLKFGDEEQKSRFLPPIVRGEIRWCQGYSEPGAGSDLASLRTHAEDQGEHFVVNGAKVWTSYADKADWIFCLVRTDREAKKHEGISFLLFDMRSEGVSTAPIVLISGSSPFCETRFDNVTVPKSQLVGGLNEGWTIAKYLLTHEREMIGGTAMSQPGRAAVSEVAVDVLGTSDGRLAQPDLRRDIARHEMNEDAFGLTKDRFRDAARAGQSLGAQSSFLKYYGTELNMRRHELLQSVLGLDGLPWEGEGSDAAKQWLRSRGNSIEGGTSEIQLNIIARRILGLPA